MSKANEIFQRIMISGGRGAGRTHQAVRSCLETGATLICHSREFAKELMDRNPGLKAEFVGSPESLAGRHNFMMPDHFYLQKLWQDREVEFKAEIRRIKREYKKNT